MTPEQIAVVTAIANLLREISGWPLGAILLLIFIGPWIMSAIAIYFQGKRSEERSKDSEERSKARFEEVVRMYENNVVLLDRSNETTKRYGELARDLREVVVMNTRAMTKACDAINSNQFCPMVRLEKKAKGVIDE